MFNFLLRMWCVRRVGEGNGFGGGVFFRIAEAEALFRYVRHGESPVSVKIEANAGKCAAAYNVNPQAVQPPRPAQAPAKAVQQPVPERAG